MKLGIITTAFQYEKGKVDYEYMRSVGYDACDFQGMMLKDGYYQSVEEQEMAEKLRYERERASDAGICIHQVHSIWPTNDKTEEGRELTLYYTKRAAVAASVLGAKFIVCHPIMPDGWSVDAEAGRTYELNRKFFTEVSRFASEMGVSVCIENMPFTKLALSDISEIMRLVSDVDLENFGVCLDTGHANILGARMGEAVNEIGDKLFALHIHDNTGWADQHRFPYCGTIDWKGFSESIHDGTHEDICLSLETNFQKNIPNGLNGELHKMLFSLLKSL